jgi:secreted PhoX family phosphatase
MNQTIQNVFKLSALALATSSLLIGCGGGGGGSATTATSGVTFAELAAPSTDAERQSIRTSPSVTIDGVNYQIGFTAFAKSGDQIGTGINNVWGQHTDALGNALTTYSDQDLVIGGKAGISSSPDHTTLLQRGGKLFSITQFEEYAGFMYITELNQNKTTGALTAVATKPIDLSGVYGGWDYCAGVPTPWGSHLGGEEYPVDVRTIESGAGADYSAFDVYLEYFGYNPTLTGQAKTDSRTAALAKTSPYRVGFPTEVKLIGDSLGDGKTAANTSAAKHYSMGRIAWELAYVMPDNKTVYAGDDSTNKGMFRYVASTAGDLSAGELFIAKLTQTNTKSTSTEGGGEFSISWISLGTAANSQIDGFIKRGISFSDMFETASITNNACPTGFSPSIANNVSECLKLKTSNNLGMTESEIKTAASRLETLRYGHAVLGGTAEFRKFEGVTFDPKRNKLYIAMSAIGSGMSTSPTLTGVADDILVKANVCGGVYQLDVNSSYVTTNMKPLLLGIPKTYTDRPIGTSTTNASTTSQQACDDAGIALPDNVSMGPTNDILMIGEDATTEHQNDFLWAYNLVTGTLTRIASGVYGGELTSPYYYRNINGWDYMTLVVQHPYDESDYLKGPDTTYGKGTAGATPASLISTAKANAMRAQAGYLGPFPVIKP